MRVHATTTVRTASTWRALFVTLFVTHAHAPHPTHRRVSSLEAVSHFLYLYFYFFTRACRRIHTKRTRNKTCVARGRLPSHAPPEQCAAGPWTPSTHHTPSDCVCACVCVRARARVRVRGGACVCACVYTCMKQRSRRAAQSLQSNSVDAPRRPASFARVAW